MSSLHMQQFARHAAPKESADASAEAVSRPGEADWARQIGAGNSGVFEAAFRAYFAELAGYAYRFVRNHDAATDIVQSVFVSLWADRGRLMVNGTLAQYLYGAVRYGALNYLRREGVARRWMDSVTTNEKVEPAQSVNHGEAVLAASDLAATIRHALTHLPERVREVTLLRWQRQLSYTEIAEALGLSVKTVEVYLARAARELRASPAFLRHLK